MKTTIVTLVLLLASSCLIQAADWPAWRGPTGQGYCEEKDVPLTWSDKENVKWKVPLKDPGNSTPVIWGQKIFLTQANTDGKVRSLICFDRAEGKVLWQRDVEYGEKERNWNPNWYANASPAVDGERVVVSFASAGMYCYDFDGKELWKRTDLGKWEHPFGSGSSPVLYGDLAILWCGPNEKEGRNFLLAVNKTNGQTVWEHDEKVGSWGTPVIAKIDGQDQLLLSVVPNLKAFDPKTGSEFWNCEGLTKYVYTSPLYANGYAVSMSGYGGAAFAVKPGGSRDITSSRLWLHPQNNQRVGSGIILGEHVYIVDENGVQHCYNLETGDDLWTAEKRVGGTTWGSMVHAEGRLYVLMRDGKTHVFAASPKYELLATNSLGPGVGTNSSLAISNGEIFIRTFKHLWCISAKK